MNHGLRLFNSLLVFDEGYNWTMDGSIFFFFIMFKTFNVEGKDRKTISGTDL